MKKIIITIFICLCLLIPSFTYAGQETPCNHNNFEINFHSNEDILRISCEDCGECININFDSILIDNKIKDLFNR